jgi:hypothetical protein
VGLGLNQELARLYARQKPSLERQLGQALGHPLHLGEFRGLNAQGQPAGSSGLKEDKAMSVETCAGLIVQGMNHRQREVVMSAQGKIGRFLKLLAPGLVEKMAMAALKDEVKPR